MMPYRPAPSAVSTQFLTAWIAFAAGAGLIGLFLLHAIAHRSDLSEIDHVAGAWSGLAWWYREGVFFPAPVNDDVFAGTRFGPVPILLQGLLFEATGEAILAGKTLQAAEMLFLIGATFALLCRLNVSAGIALLVAAMPLATAIGWQAGTGIRHDALAPALQLTAMTLVLGQTRPVVTAILGSSLLCALAVFVKLSALWGAASITLWLLFRHPRLGLLHAVAGIVAGLAFLTLFYTLTEGRYPEVILTTAFENGETGISATFIGLAKAAKKMVMLFTKYAPATWAVLPFAAVAAGFSLKNDRILLLTLAIIILGVTLLPLYMDSGIQENHLLDVIVLVNILAAAAFMGARKSPKESSFHLVAILSLAFFALSQSFVAQMPARTMEAIRLLQGAQPSPDDEPERLLTAIPEGPVLSVNALIPVLRNQPPVVLDAFMLKRIWEQHPEVVAPLVEAINARRFSAIVTRYNLGDPPTGIYFAEMHWGPEIIKAIEANYRIDKVVNDLTIRLPYAPAHSPGK